MENQINGTGHGNEMQTAFTWGLIEIVECRGQIITKTYSGLFEAPKSVSISYKESGVTTKVTIYTIGDYLGFDSNARIVWRTVVFWTSSVLGFN